MEEIIKSLLTAKEQKEEAAEKLQKEFSSLDEIRTACVAEIKKKMADEIATIETQFQASSVNLRINIQSLNSEIMNIDRAITALMPRQPNPAKSSSSPKITSEMIHDAVITLLFQFKDEPVLMTAIIADMDRRGYLDPSKSSLAVMTSMMTNMVRLGLVNRVNDGFMLVDEQEAIQRLRIRRTILEFIRNAKRGVTLEAIRNHLIAQGFVHDPRRVNGVLLGLGRRYLEKRTNDAGKEEYFFSSQTDEMVEV